MQPIVVPVITAVRREARLEFDGELISVVGVDVTYQTLIMKGQTVRENVLWKRQ